MTRLVLIQALILIALAIPLTRFYGGAGTAVAVGFSFLISAGYLIYFGYDKLKVNVMESAGLPLLNNLIALIAYGVVHPLLALEQLPIGVRLGAEGALFIGLYAAASLITSRDILLSRARYIMQVARG